jgi:anti-sigma B factor antagonist
MANPSATLFVCATDHAAILKIHGRANFSCSVHFKTVVNELYNRGAARFILDLDECATMDSTFLGVLAGLALKLSDDQQKPVKPALEIYKPNERVLELLDNLGIAHFFTQIATPPVLAGEFTATAPAETPASKEELSQTCLEAHKTLMAVNPNNIPKFKEVTQFLAEDLKKSKPPSQT